MHKNIKRHQMTSNQIFMLAVNVCQWWNAVFFQAGRFFKALDELHGAKHPWDDGENYSLFGAERIFLIIAMYHAIEDLQKLNVEIQRENDMSLQFVLDDIEKVAPWEDVKNLRDMNIHNLDYLVEKGQKQDKFRSKIKIADDEVLTTAAWTYDCVDEDMVFLGNVQVKELLSVMKKHLPFVRQKTKQVYDKTLI